MVLARDEDSVEELVVEHILGLRDQDLIQAELQGRKKTPTNPVNGVWVSKKAS